MYKSTLYIKQVNIFIYNIFKKQTVSEETQKPEQTSFDKHINVYHPKIKFFSVEHIVKIPR